MPSFALVAAVSVASTRSSATVVFALSVRLTPGSASVMLFEERSKARPSMVSCAFFASVTVNPSAWPCTPVVVWVTVRPDAAGWPGTKPVLVLVIDRKAWPFDSSTIALAPAPESLMAWATAESVMPSVSVMLVEVPLIERSSVPPRTGSPLLVNCALRAFAAVASSPTTIEKRPAVAAEPGVAVNPEALPTWLRPSAPPVLSDAVAVASVLSLLVRSPSWLICDW